MIRVGVIDNDKCALEYIISTLRRITIDANKSWDIWGSTISTEALQECCNETRKSNLLFIDMALNGISGTEVAKEILHRSPSTKIIGITAYDTDSYQEDAQNAGMLALIDKSRLSSTLSYEFIISTLHNTKTQQLRSTPPRQENEEYKPLTQIEQRVVALSLQSFTTRQIAEKLNVSAQTVLSHHRNIKKKIHKKTWFDALQYCKEKHLV